MTELEQKRFAKANIEANVILLTIGAVIFLGIPALLIGGCKYMVHRSEVAKEKEELRRERIRAEFEAKYPSQNSSASYDSSPRSSSDDVHGAWAYIQIYVERQLKSPGSAKFPFGGSRHVTPLGGDRYRVNSYVDAQNAFGANVRTNFNGVIKKVSGGWLVESFSLGQ